MTEERAAAIDEVARLQVFYRECLEVEMQAQRELMQSPGLVRRWTLRLHICRSRLLMDAIRAKQRATLERVV